MEDVDALLSMDRSALSPLSSGCIPKGIVWKLENVLPPGELMSMLGMPRAADEALPLFFEDGGAMMLGGNELFVSVTSLLLLVARLRASGELVRIGARPFRPGDRERSDPTPTAAEMDDVARADTLDEDLLLPSWCCMFDGGCRGERKLSPSLPPFPESLILRLRKEKFLQLACLDPALEDGLELDRSPSSRDPGFDSSSLASGS